MNRAQRRQTDRELARLAKTASKQQVGSDGVMLHGGPMDGWYVKPDAPALNPRWYTTWPDSVREKHAPGRYVRVGERDGVDAAEWHPLG